MALDGPTYPLPVIERKPSVQATRAHARVALVTCRALPDLEADDRLVLAPLAALGVDAEPVVWDDPDADWSGYDLAVLRLTVGLRGPADAVPGLGVPRTPPGQPGRRRGVEHGEDVPGPVGRGRGTGGTHRLGAPGGLVEPAHVGPVRGQAGRRFGQPGHRPVRRGRPRPPPRWPGRTWRGCRRPGVWSWCSRTWAAVDSARGRPACCSSVAGTATPSGRGRCWRGRTCPARVPAAGAVPAGADHLPGAVDGGTGAGRQGARRGTGRRGPPALRAGRPHPRPGRRSAAGGVGADGAVAVPGPLGRRRRSGSPPPSPPGFHEAASAS